MDHIWVSHLPTFPKDALYREDIDNVFYKKNSMIETISNSQNIKCIVHRTPEEAQEALSYLLKIKYQALLSLNPLTWVQALKA